MDVTMYGVKTCDTIRKARAWLQAHGVDYRFHDYKTEGVDAGRLRQWCDEHGWETVLNRSGTTFRKLSEADRAGIDEHKAVALMQAQPSLIKRPVLDLGPRRIVGFRPEVYATALGAAAQTP
jgi:arsenate reductase